MIHQIVLLAIPITSLFFLATVTNHDLVLSTNNTARMTIDNDGYPLFSKDQCSTVQWYLVYSPSLVYTYKVLIFEFKQFWYDPDNLFKCITRFTARMEDIFNN